MSLFRKKKNEIEVDERTELEKSFEEKGQSVGRETGKIVQKGIDKVTEIKEKLEAEGKFDKVKEIKEKTVKSVDQFVEKTKQKAGEVVSKVKNK